MNDMLRDGDKRPVLLPGMTSRRRLPCVVLFVAMRVWWGVVVFAQAPEPQTQPTKQLTAATVEKLIKQIEQSTDLDMDVKQKTRTIAQQALADLKSAEGLAKRAAEFEQNAKNVDDRRQRIRDELSSPPPKLDLDRFRSTTTPELELELKQWERKHDEWKKSLVDVIVEPARRAGRRKQVRALLLLLPGQKQDVVNQLKLKPPEDEPPLLTDARRMALQARYQTLQTKEQLQQAELALYDAEDAVGFVSEQRKMLEKRVAVAEDAVKKFRGEVNKSKKRDSDARLKKAHEEFIHANPLLQPIARRNEELASKEQEIIGSAAKATGRLASVQGRLEQLQKRSTKTRQRVERVGLTEAVGLMLRTDRGKLPDVRRYQRSIGLRRQTIREAQTTLFKLQDDRANLADIDEQVSTEVPGATSELETAATKLFEDRQNLLDTLIGHYERYIDELGALDDLEQQLINDTNQYGSYIDEHVLWIQSSQMFSTEDVVVAGGAIMWLLDPGSWYILFQSMAAETRSNPIAYALVLLLVLVGCLQGRFRRELKSNGKQAAKRTCYSLAPTLWATLLSLPIAAIWPGVLLCVAWQLWSCADQLTLAASDSAEFIKAVGTGLATVAAVAVPFTVIRALCRPHGLGAAHFEWTPASLRQLRQFAGLYLLAGLPMVFVSATMRAQSNAQWADSLGRLCFLIALLLAAFCLRRLLHPANGVLNDFLADNRGGWLNRLRYVWYPLVVLSPIVFAVLAFAGYFFTAWQLVQQLVATACVVLAVLTVRGVLMRFILVNHRRLAFAEARERLAAITKKNADTSEADEPAAPASAGEVVDLATINSQTQRLLNASLVTVSIVGLWLVWVDVLPALGILDTMTLWHTTVQVTEEVPTNAVVGDGTTLAADASGGSKQFQTVDRYQAITVADLAFAVLVVVLMLIAARNLPALLEIALLRHLPLDASIRFAISSLSSYAIIVLGVVLAAGAIGVGWAKVQWLAAALTFGLAFGLQEIFANFISGLILLFERPIRVGDIVTIDGVTGVVSRIRFRATTITNWDRKEFIVPNKEFITGRLMNWTLSDSLNRVVIKVGVAYGSDTDQVRNLLLDIARQHPIVLDDPGPLVSFEQFGDSTLNFVVRAYLPNMDNRLSVIHDLHTAIHQRFGHAGINIAFPQRDIHIHSDGQLPVPTRLDSPGAHDRERTLAAHPLEDALET
jgi:potassium efflux system protein